MPVENELCLKDDSNFSHISKLQVNGEPMEYDQVVPVCPSNTIKEIQGSYKGKIIAPVLLEVLEDWEIITKLGWIINAETIMKAL